MRLEKTRTTKQSARVTDKPKKNDGPGRHDSGRAYTIRAHSFSIPKMITECAREHARCFIMCFYIIYEHAPAKIGISGSSEKPHSDSTSGTYAAIADSECGRIEN